MPSTYGNSYGRSPVGRYSGSPRYTSRYGSYREGGFYSGGSYNRPSHDPGRYKPRYPSWRDEVDGPNDSRSRGYYSNFDLQKTDNAAAHHTDLYGVYGLVVRRGQEFKVTVRFDQGYSLEAYNAKIQFATGDEPKMTKNTLVRLSLEDKKLNNEEWGARVSKHYVQDEIECIEVTIISAHDAIVGKYSMSVDMRPKENHGDDDVGGGRKRFKCDQEIYLIFNPWCQDDQVYMSDPACLEEYVMNETGRIYVGQLKTLQGRPWNFGQFGKASLEAAMYLLETSYLRKSAHGNPTLVCRAMASMANSNDEDGGVLTGNWSGDYSGGTSPMRWNGSVAILDRFMMFKRPVRYGQCWVFSGLLTTLMRSLGVPSRSVTNYQSAHDTDFSMSIDNHVDSEGRPIRELDDSVWNFHVWNESWFERPDLPSGFGGWQAYDATPQELSDNLNQCGPAPVRAIKEGNVFFGFDTKFLFAEVNGDRITWMVDEDGAYTATSVDLNSVGRSISTKMVGSPDRDDVTDQYKYPEGSREEREAVKRASQHSSRKDVLKTVYNLQKRQDVTFGCDGHVEPNGDAEFELDINNSSSDPRTMHVRMYTTAKFYTGVPGQEISSKKFDITVEGEKDEKLKYLRHAYEYMNKVPEDADIGVYVLVKVEETGQIYTAQRTYAVVKPELEVVLNKNRVKINEELEVTISVTNPLSVDLTSGAFNLEGPGIQKEKQILLNSFVKPGQVVSETLTLVPKYPGRREIIASFNSRQLTSIVGSATVQVV